MREKVSNKYTTEYQVVIIVIIIYILSCKISVKENTLYKKKLQKYVYLKSGSFKSVQGKALPSFKILIFLTSKSSEVTKLFYFFDKIFFFEFRNEQILLKAIWLQKCFVYFSNVKKKTTFKKNFLSLTIWWKYVSCFFILMISFNQRTSSVLVAYQFREFIKERKHICANLKLQNRICFYHLIFRFYSD